MQDSQIRTWKRFLGWIAVGFVLFFIWDMSIMYPFRMLAIFFHEMSHGLAAILTGGSVERLALDPGEGGHAITRGGSTFLISSAGYLGNVLWGGAIMYASAYFKGDRILSYLLGGILLAVTLILVRSWFGFAFGLVSGAALLLLGWKGSTLVNDLTLRFIGVFSCLYAVFDIKSDVLDRPEIRSDARILAETTMVPTLVWGWLWFITAIVLFIGILWTVSRHERRERKPA